MTRIIVAEVVYYGHMERKDDEDWVKGCIQLVVLGTAPVVKTRNIWQDFLSADLNVGVLRTTPVVGN